MHLGLMPGMRYEEKELLLEPGENILFYSDGLVEAHNTRREMFSFGRLSRLVGEHEDASSLINRLLDELARFTGPDWEQEDDVTLVTLQRAPETPSAEATGGDGESNWKMLGDFKIPSAEGNERLAMKQVADALKAIDIPLAQVERIKTAVAEATMNAMEHGNKYQLDRPVLIQVRASDTLLSICITDEGGSEMIATPDSPNLEAKLEGVQSPRGWGLFLIQNMVDKMNIIRDESHHTVELIVYLEGEKHGSQPA